MNFSINGLCLLKALDYTSEKKPVITIFQLQRMTLEELQETCMELQLEFTFRDDSEDLINLLSNIFYTYYDLCDVDRDTLNALAKSRGIFGSGVEGTVRSPFLMRRTSSHINTDELITTIILKQIKIRLSKPRCEDQPFKVYELQSGFFNKIIRRLNILPDGNFLPYLANKWYFNELYYIQQLDNTMKTHEFQENPVKGYVYRGVYTDIMSEVQRPRDYSRPDTFVKILKNIAFTSCSTDINIAERFIEKAEMCCIIRFKIPHDIKYLDARRLNQRNEEEILLERNTFFDFFNPIGQTDRGTYVMETILIKSHFTMDSLFE